MSYEQSQRRLAAILVADVVGYSKLMGADEAGTLAALKRMRVEHQEPSVAQNRGRLVKTTGDGILVEFSSAVDAMRCAMTMQSGLAKDHDGLTLRIGVNVGDIVVENSDLFGDCINIAARLETTSEPGGVAFSSAVRDYLFGRVDGEFRDGGACLLKNIDRPIHVWHWSPGLPSPGFNSSASSKGDGFPAPALPEKPSIVVLPFDNMSGDPEQEYFADGVVESITATLSRIRAFFVIARNSAFAYKGKAVKVQDIGRELGVAYLLEGSVQRAGQRVRITVQLIETANGAHLWAEKYDGTIDDIFDLQDRITEQIAGALEPSIRQAEVTRARRKRPQDMGAYDFTMRAFRHVWALEKEEASAALDLLDKALELEPDYPLALALAAWCWAQRSVYDWVPDLKTARQKALSLADRAAGFSTDDPLILTVLGTVNTFVRKYGGARVLLERALALDPNSAWTLSRLGWLEIYADRPHEAKIYLEKAIRLSPLDPLNFNNYAALASAHQVAKEDEQAANYFIRALEERPNAHWIHRNLAPALLAAGRKEEARESFNLLRQAYPDMTAKKFRQAMVFSDQMMDRVIALLLELGLPEE